MKPQLAMLLALVLIEAPSTSNARNGSDGLIGPELPTQVAIAYEGSTGRDQQVLRLRYGRKAPPAGRARGYVEFLARFRLRIHVGEEGVALTVDGSLDSVLEQSPAGLAAVQWGIRRDREFTWTDLVESVRLYVDGARLTPIRTWGAGALFAEPEDYENARLEAEALVEFMGGRTTLRFPVSASPARFALSRLQVSGMFVRPVDDQPPPIAPSSTVDAHGRFTIHVPEGWLHQGGQLNEVDLYVYDHGERPVRLVRRIAGLQLLAEEERRSAALILPKLLPEFWTLSGGPYRARLDVRSPAGGAVPLHQFETPPIESTYILAALGLRLDALSRELFGMPFYEWRSHREREEDQAINLMWKALVEHAGGFRASVRVSNSSDPGRRATQDLALYAVLSDGSEYRMGVRRVVLGAGDEEESFAVPAGSDRVLGFQPFRLGSTGAEIRERLDRLVGFEVRGQPFRVGAGARNRRAYMAVRPRANVASEDPRFQLAQSMRSLGPLPAGELPDDPAPYIDALFKALEAPALGVNIERTHRRAQGMQQGVLDECLDALSVLDQRLEAFGDTGFGKLELAMSQDAAAGRQIIFGARDLAHPTIGGRTSVQPLTFEIKNSTWKTGWSAVAAAINPELSFAIDPDLLLGSARGADEEAAGPAQRSGWMIAGIDRWRWIHDAGAAADAYLLGEISDNPRVGEMAGAVFSPGPDGVARRLAGKVRPGGFDLVKGEINEGFAFEQFVRDRGGARRRRPSAFDGRVLAISSDQIRGAAGGQLTDGVLLGVAPDGTVHLLEAAEAKAGQAAARELGMQLALDRYRLKNEGFELVELRPDQQQVLGLDTARRRFPPGAFEADFADPEFFQTFVPTDVDVESRLPDVRSAPPSAELSPSQRRAQAALADLARAPPEQRRSIQRALNEPRRTGYDARDVESVTELAFRRAGVEDHAWNAKDLDFAQFKALVDSRHPNAGALAPAELRQRYRDGQRWNPDTGNWEDALAPIERPVLSPDQVMALRDASVRAPARNRDTAIARARRGDRFDPATKQWFSPDAPSSPRNIYVVDPTLPRALLPDDEFLVWWEVNRPPGSPPDEAEVLRRRRQGFVFTPTGELIRPNPADVRRAAVVEGGLATRQWDRWSRRKGRLGANAELAADAGTELIDRAAAALREGARVGGETLKVVVQRDIRHPQTNIQVVLQTGDQTIELPPATQKAVLKNWYRRQRLFPWGDDGVSAWLDQASP